MSTQDEVEGLVLQAGAAACSALTEAAGTPFCAFFFSKAGVGAIQQFIMSIIPESWQAAGVFDYLTISDAVVPRYSKLYQNSLQLLDTTWSNSRQGLGLAPKDSPMAGYLNGWLYQNGWQQGGAAAPGLEHHIYLEPDKGPWAFRWQDWPNHPDGVHQKMFRDALCWLYMTHRITPLQQGIKVGLDYIKSMLAQEVRKRQLSVVQRGVNRVNVFLVREDGGIWTRAWWGGGEGEDSGWGNWTRILDLCVATGAQVTAVSRHPNKLDVLTIGSDNRVWTAASDVNVGNGAWYGWWCILNGVARPGSPVAIVSRDPNKLDVFIIGADGGIWTAAWDAHVANGAWRGWWRIGVATAAPGSPVAIVSRDPNKLDVFIIGAEGGIWTAAWDAHVANGAWRGWSRVLDAIPDPHSTISVVSRDPAKLDVFIVASDGSIYTAAMDDNYDHGAWRGWWGIGSGLQPGAAIQAVARDPNKLDVFTFGTDNGIYTAAWDQYQANATWRGWWRVLDGLAATDSPLAVESRGPNLLDVFILGLDGAIWEADWNGDWAGWWNTGP
jgi:hypothetical protein